MAGPRQRENAAQRRHGETDARRGEIHEHREPDPQRGPWSEQLTTHHGKPVDRIAPGFRGLIRSEINRPGIRAENEQQRGDRDRADQRQRNAAPRIARFLGQRPRRFESAEEEDAKKQSAEKIPPVRIAPGKDRPRVGRAGLDNGRRGGEQEGNDRDTDDDKLHTRGRRSAAHVEKPRHEAHGD